MRNNYVRGIGVYEPFVYVIKEVSTGYFYIGSKTSFLTRKCLESDLGSNYFTSSAYIKQKWLNDHASFIIVMIESCETSKEAFEREIELIELNNAVKSNFFLNKNKGGVEFNTTGLTHSQEAKKKISLNNGCRGGLSEHHKMKIKEANIGRVTSEETKKKLSNRHVSQETRDKISLAFKGITRGPMKQSVKDKISSSLSGRKLSEDHIEKINSKSTRFKGKSHSKETKEKISKKTKGSKRSDETKRKLSESAKKRKRILCPHCRKEIPVNVFGRYHGDNCKSKF